MTSPLQQLLQHPDLWRPGDRQTVARTGQPTGFAALDQALHGGGWPRAALTELLLPRPGSGELRLLLPLLAALSRQRQWQLWIDPPFTPYAPALLQGGVLLEQLVIVRPADRRQLLWACAQALQAPGCGAVLCWPGTQPLRYAELRKLQVAAGERQCCGFLLRAGGNAAQASPSALRLQLRAVPGGSAVEILKQRGGSAGQRILLPGTAALQQQAAPAEQPFVVGTEPAAALPQPLPGSAAPVREVVWQ